MIRHNAIGFFRLIGLLLLLPACVAPPPENDVTTDSLRLGSLTFEKCRLDGSSGQPLLPAYCATVTVKEDTHSTSQNARFIDLHVAWLPPRQSSRTARDPVFFISGGPGQSALQSYPQIAAAFSDIQRTRGVMLLDQRGTGDSHPLHCDLPEDDNAAIHTLQSAARQCVDELSTRADLRHYTTLEAVTDLETVRKAIGVKQINVVAVSYGTRVAQHYARLYPQSVRSLVLDSPIPNDVSLAIIPARNLDEALNMQFTHCSHDPTCHEKLGNPRAELDRLLTQLRSNPPIIHYRDANSGQMRTDILHAEKVAALVRLYAYHPASAALLPQLINQANHGHYSELMALAQLARAQMQGSLALGMQLSVICSEDAPYLSALPDDSDTVLGNRPAQTLAAICEVWPQKSMPADFYPPLSSTVPALVLNGEFDPITPPRYGQHIAASLPNARSITLSGQGHAVLSSGCLPKLLARFMDTADAHTLEITCLSQLQAIPPFTSLNGGEP